MNNIIEVRDVTKKFKEYTALNHVTVSFQEGKIHGIVGRNGSGKTVLMKCICGLMHQDTGEIVIHNKRIGKDVDIAEGIGAIIESPGFLNNYSAIKNLQFLAGINRKIKKQEIEEYIELVGLDPKNKKHVGKYSMGMRQRLGLAQALMENPEILILDEPMNGLDNQGVEEMRKLLLKMKKDGKTILLASHNKEDIKVLCDTVHEMDQGFMQEAGD